MKVHSAYLTRVRIVRKFDHKHLNIKPNEARVSKCFKDMDNLYVLF